MLYSNQVRKCNSRAVRLEASVRPEASPERTRLCPRYETADYRGLVSAMRRASIRTSSARSRRPGTGTVRRWLTPEISESERTACRAVLRRPGVAAWALLFAVLGLSLGSSGVQRLAASLQGPAVFEARVRSNVDAVLGAVGPPIGISRVEVIDLPRHVAARYTYDWNRISVSPRLDRYSDDDLLHVMSHEVVHAMFDQGRLRLYEGAPDPSHFVLSEEVAADVLGAYIAGSVRARSGGDGAGLTCRLVQEHREQSDPTMPRSFYQRFGRARASFGSNAVDPRFEYSVFLHYGSPERVDEMDRICRENPGPWDAAREISRRYLTWEREKERPRELLARVREAN